MLGLYNDTMCLEKTQYHTSEDHVLLKTGLAANLCSAPTHTRKKPLDYLTMHLCHRIFKIHKTT